MSDVPVLGLLLLAAVLTAPWWIKRVRPGATTGPVVRVIGRTAISRNAVIAVVRVGERQLLVGAAEQGVSVLTELDPGDAPLALVAPDDLPDHPSTEPAASALDPRLWARTDAAPATTDATLEQLLEGADGPRIGPMDRLRAMTVRTTPPGRPIRVPLRR